MKSDTQHTMIGFPVTVDISLAPVGRMPTKAHPHDAAWDIYAAALADIPPATVGTVYTGVHVNIPPGWYGQLLTRSGYARIGLFVQAGVIDSGYTGEIRVLMFNAARIFQRINAGDRVAQLVLHPVISVQWREVDVLADTARGANGFGSSGL